jgi:hypothetical protein
MSHAASSPSRSGCGCGGSSRGAGHTSGGKGGGCSCGGGCGSCQGQDFARPRFFAGQLLTEDDLDLLGRYVVEKNRLHNRSFFGEGVVCGLLVTCDPCGGGQVTVQPGHALDCCGNDIVVSCPQPVDVNALVKRLRLERNGGVDCGDPCSDEKATPKNGSGMSSASFTSSSSQQGVPALPPGEYCLYVRYCEQATDPVSPYATEDPCGAQACEPTRIREGFTFELRCRTCEDEKPDNLFSRIGECLGNLVTTEKTTRSARSALLYSGHLARAVSLIDAQKPAAFVGADRLEEVKRSVVLVENLPRGDDWTALHAFDAADAARTFASLSAAWHGLPEEEKARLENRSEVEAAAKGAGEQLKRLAGLLPKVKLDSLIDDPLDREVVRATTERALPWADPESAAKAIPAGERELLMAGAVYTKATRASMASYLALIKANLIDRLQSRGYFTDCTLLKDVQSIVIPDDDPANAATKGDAALAKTATERLLDVLIRYLRQCICDAINPPCPPCDDPAVLLACLRVEGCDVVDICNLERTFVLTPVALRYWMPFLRSLGEALERVCCPDDGCDPKARTTSRLQTASEPLPRAYVERRSALPTAENLLGPGELLDPSRLAAVLPARLSFSPENARLLAYATAQVIDVVSLRRGVPVGDIVAATLPRAVDVPFIGGPPAPPPPAPPSVVPPETIAEIRNMHARLDELKTKLADSVKKNRDLENRVKKLER